MTTSVKLYGIERLRHAVSVDLDDVELAHLKELIAAENDDAISEWIGEYFSSATVDDGEYEDCEAQILGPDGKYRQIVSNPTKE